MFVAVDVPAGQKDSVEAALSPLKALLPGARWTPPDNWHVTLNFFGEVPEGNLPGIKEGISRALDGATGIVSRLGEVGAFPSIRRARVLWVGLEDPGLAMGGWAARIGAECGIEPERPLHPHLTVARLKVPADIGPAVDRLSPFDLDRSGFGIDSVTLFRSYTERTGPRYEPLESWRLRPGGNL